jgi:hypothetical protein
MEPLCGKPLTPEDRRVWQQSIGMLVGLKIRNGIREKELVAAVGTALRASAAGRNKCEDCGLKVARGAAINSAGGGGISSAWQFLSPPDPNPHRISCEPRMS